MPYLHRMKALALLGVLALVGCGSARQPTPVAPIVTDSLPQSQHTFHSAGAHYSVRQVEQAFADQGVHLRDTTHFRTLQPWDFLDGRPAHPVYVYVDNYPCKCIFRLKLPYAHRTGHGNITVSWRPAARPAVLAALRELR